VQPFHRLVGTYIVTTFKVGLPPSSCLQSVVSKPHNQCMVEYRQTLLELPHKTYLELKAISSNSDINNVCNGNHNTIESSCLAACVYAVPEFDGPRALKLACGTDVNLMAAMDALQILVCCVDILLFISGMPFL
jgi:hypothetical protein